MKTFKQLKKLMRDGDKEFIANQLKISASLVRMVVNENRTDHYGILEAFTILVSMREGYTKKIITEIARLRKRLEK
jgi:hypothetical protein